MMSDARQKILARLRHAPRPDISGMDPGAVESPVWDPEERIRRFTERMTAVRAEIIETTEAGWIETLKSVCVQKQLGNLLYSPATERGVRIRQQPPLEKLLTCEQEIEDWKSELFHTIDAAVTTTLGGIAETGTLILWPDKNEPRMMSLVPPIHIAILESGKLFNTFAEAVATMQWAGSMPTNALLISGPSKSADIEQTLAYGVHGPKELVILLIKE
jgi:L-lactate dehydrogenase complex protein LldG